MMSEEHIKENGRVFAREVKEKIANLRIPPNAVWNSDQSQFKYEPMRDRTIAYKGEKIVAARVIEKNAVSHSYSIQVHLSKGGIPGSKLYIVLQEKSGAVFGPLVQEKVNGIFQQRPNIALSCSKSGKFTSEILGKWYPEIFLPEVADYPDSMLLLDAWKGQGPSAGLNNPKVRIEYIPKGATGDIQPLDVYFFRHYKALVKNLMDRCRNFYFDEEAPVKPSNRYFMIKLHCVCYNQFQHPRFGTRGDMRGENQVTRSRDLESIFRKKSDVLFGPLNSREPHCVIHDDYPLLKCEHCERFLCFECMFHPIHYHLVNVDQS